jgi:hypothetical protein
VSVQDLARELQALQQQWGLIAVSAVAATPNGNLKVSLTGDPIIIAFEDDHGHITVVNPDALLREDGS